MHPVGPARQKAQHACGVLRARRLAQHLSFDHHHGVRSQDEAIRRRRGRDVHRLFARRAAHKFLGRFSLLNLFDDVARLHFEIKARVAQQLPAPGRS
jgi:hypothetical protein